MTKITDLFFSDSQLESLKESAKNLWQLQKDRIVNVTFNGTSESIITAEKDGKYVFALATMNAGVSSGVLPEKRSITLSIYCYYSKFKPEDVIIEYNERGSATTFVNDKGTWRTAKSGEFSPTNAILYFSRNESYTTWCDEVNNIFSDLRKVKFYFNIVTTYPYIRDLTIDNIKYGASNCPNYSSFIYSDLVLDISNCSFAKNSGFIPVNVVFWNIQSRDYQYYYDFTVDKTKSPSPSSNPEDDDPNDDDPGWQDPDDDDDGDKGGDGDHDDSSDPIPEDPLPPISGTSNGLITAWNPSSSQLESLATKLWNPDAWSAIKQYFTNPMESILSLAIIPVKPNTVSGTIHLGGYNTEISSGRVTNDYVKFDCGSIPINRYYGSYLDYAPFTKISCTLPYIGEVDIDPDQVMQKTLSISYHINCITGELVAYLLADNNVFATYAGNCIKQLPICQTDFSSIISSAVQVCSTLITAGASSASAGAVEKSLFGATTEATKASESLVKANSSLLGSVMSAKMNYRHSSQLGTGAGQLASQCPFLTIIRPNLDLADNYKAFTGYPCNENVSLSSLHGFTQVEASNLSVPSASLDEISEIKELLLKGVIL